MLRWMEGERDEGMAGCTCARCQEKKLTFAVESVSVFHLNWLEFHPVPVLASETPDFNQDFLFHHLKFLVTF